MVRKSRDRVKTDYSHQLQHPPIHDVRKRFAISADDVFIVDGALGNGAVLPNPPLPDGGTHRDGVSEHLQTLPSGDSDATAQLRRSRFRRKGLARSFRRRYGRCCWLCIKQYSRLETVRRRYLSFAGSKTYFNLMKRVIRPMPNVN